MNSNKKVLNIVCLIFSLVGLIFFIVGGIFRGSMGKLKENCTETTTGIILDYEEKEQKDSEGHYDTYYYAIYEYDVDGKTIEHTSSLGVGNKPDDEGESVDVHYNPNDVYECYIDSELKTSGVLAIVFQVVGGVLLIIGLARFVIKIPMLIIWAFSKKS